MGSSRWSAADWDNFSAQTAGQTRQQIFSQTHIHPDLDPRNITVRESVDSPANPESTPIIIGVDETGSMGTLAETIIRTGLGTIMEEIYDRRPVTDPHVLCMGIGDAYSDRAPLQVTQFEASIVLADQVKNIFLEGNGGGNGGESYNLAWWFAAYKTRCDAQMKRHRKGYLFTIGDEPPHHALSRDHIINVLGGAAESDISTKDLLAIVSQQWEVFHLIVNPGSYPDAITTWRDLLGERAMLISDHTKLAEVIVSTIQIIEGHSYDDAVGRWSGDTAIVVANATKALTRNQAARTDVIRL
ncbi:MAG: hypothetical protein JWQ98_230 [Chlorobi bacterium]|nr:hypothetical protein [Chlorobiota bacterium]